MEKIYASEWKMAPPVFLSLSSAIFLISLFILHLTSPTRHVAAHQCFDSIISFGDSLADTGNLLHITTSQAHHPPPYNFFLPPYGETYFHHPTGRCSDGRLVIDFIAQSFGLPFVSPYFGGNINDQRSRSFDGGVNFAVVGASALDSSFFDDKGIKVPFTNVSLGIQLGWFREMLRSCDQFSSDCENFIQNSLILMGEIGGNDYNNALLAKFDKQQIQSFAPAVIDTISLAIQELIKLGALTIMVPGNLPIGCLSVYLREYRSSNQEDYDPKTGCLNWLNELSAYHNELLQKELRRLQKMFPNSTLIYADYYNAAIRFFQSPQEFGFKKGSTLEACCGKGGLYNFNFLTPCGSLEATSCDDPSSFVIWDGLHLTEAAYRWIARGMLDGKFTIPPLPTLCYSRGSSFI